MDFLKNLLGKSNSDIFDYVVFDLETTGFNPINDEIIEIGAIKVSSGKAVSTFHALVNPGRPIFKNITDITGITSGMVSNAPRISEVLPKFLDYIGNNVLVGHNIASFDIPFIEAYTQEHLKNKVIDTLRLSKECYPDLRAYNLSYLATYLGIEPENAHRALDDAKTNYHVFEALKRDCLKKGIDLFASSKVQKAIVQKSIWQPNYTEDTVALQGLKSLLSDVISDNEVDVSEVYLIQEWMGRNENLRGNFPFDKVFLFLEKVLEDGIVEASEREGLLVTFNELLDPVKAAKHGAIESFQNKHFILTGDFEYGSKDDVERLIVEKGGIIDQTVKKTTNYVLVGALGSAAWSQGNYGSKVKKALEYNEKYASKGVSIDIIQETDFFKELK